MLGHRMGAFALATLSALLLSAPPAAAAKYDGTWSMTAVTTKGHCGVIPIGMGVKGGRIYSTGGSFAFYSIRLGGRVSGSGHANLKAVAGPRNRSATRPEPAPRPLWVQASSPSAGSVWAGAYLDANDNGEMEFAPMTAALPKGEWTRQLNFLAIRPAAGKDNPDLSAGAKVRLTIQWRETHDPTAYAGRDAIFPLTLRVFQQLDPDGKMRASDELQEIARSSGGPYPVDVEPTYGVYEQVVEFTVPVNGRYCVMVEGQEVYDPRLPALRRHIEIRPRLFASFTARLAA